MAPGDAPPTTGAVRAALAHAAASGYRAAVTGALAERERAPFVDAGLAPHSWLHLLERSLDTGDLPSANGVVLRRIRRSEWPVRWPPRS